MAKKKGNKKAAGRVSTPTRDDSDSEVELAFSKEESTESLADDSKILNVDEDGNDLGGLMATLMASKTTKGKKGKKKRNDDDEEDAAAILARLDLEEADEADEAVAAPPVKKGKGKEKKGKPATPAESEDEAPPVQAKGKKPAKKAVEEEPVSVDDIPEPGEIRIKSKKEKEKERKERAKLAKKQQEKKKAPATVSAAAPAPAPESEPVDDEQTQKDKKKKGAAKTKPAGGALALLKQQLAAQKAAEEEARRLQEEEERRIAEEEARLAEEQKKKEEARLKKKEKEKAKKEELKRQGKYLTPAQKAAQAQQKARLEAMIAAGMKVEGLEEGEKKPKKVVYDNRRKGKKGPQQQQQPPQPSSPKPEEQGKAVSEPEKSEEPEQPVTPQNEVEAEAARVAAVMLGALPQVKESWDQDDGEVKDSWDADSDDNVKDSWDMDSEDEKEKVAAEKAKKEAKAAQATNVGKKETPAPANASKAPPSPAPESDASESEESEESEEESDSESDSDSDSDAGLTATQRQALQKREEAAARRAARQEAALAARSADDLRSPICCILGHVDTGKTKLLDKIRQTNVQEGEAGGITQQIGATYFPISAIREKTEMLYKDAPAAFKIPGLLIIDTPGHESFTNLRSRGSSLCNIAILVVDIVHGLEPQTLESLNLLRQRKTPFIVALNKIDRMFDWEAHPNYPTRDTLALQKPHVLREFNDRVQKTMLEFAEQGLNAYLYYDNPNMARNVSLVPTSAITGEGVPDLLNLLVDLTQTRMEKNLMYVSELECTVLEVKVVEGLGTTIDVVLSNGILREGDRICVCGLNGPIVTTIRALLTPQPMRELRVKSAYIHHKEIKAAMGVKITAPDLEKAIAGARLLVIGEDDDEDEVRATVMEDLTSLLTAIDKSGKGVCVQASTLGSLEALLTFLKDMKIPVSGINIGPVHKKDVIRSSVMLERAPEYAQLLAFDVPIDKEAAALAEDLGVKIFTAEIIYHLFDSYTAYMKDLDEKRKADAAPRAVFPCLLRIVPGAVFNKRNPIVLGVDVVEGNLRIGTPLCCVNDGVVVPLGKVTSIELNHKAVQEAKKAGPAVAIKIEGAEYETPKLFGRHFTEKNELMSHITRGSIDILKTTFRNDVSKDEWALIIKLKKFLNIQ